MRKLSGIALAVALVAACGAATPSPTSAPSVVASVAPSPASTSAAPSAAACVDIGELADVGDPIENALRSIEAALAGGKVADAQASAATASAGMRSVAGDVEDGSPDASAAFLAAADELDQAAAKFPAGADLFTKAKTDVEAAFVTARAAACP